MDDDDDFIGIMFDMVVGLITLMIMIGVEIVVICIMAISFIFEMFFEDKGD